MSVGTLQRFKKNDSIKTLKNVFIRAVQKKQQIRSFMIVSIDVLLVLMVRRMVWAFIFQLGQSTVMVIPGQIRRKNAVCMFVSRVLVGKTTLGNATMKTRPVGFDSSTNESHTTVTYHDAQAYAEYLITYKYGLILKLYTNLDFDVDFFEFK